MWEIASNKNLKGCVLYLKEFLQIFQTSGNEAHTRLNKPINQLSDFIFHEMENDFMCLYRRKADLF